MTEESKRKVIYCFIAILIALLAFVLAQNAQDTANAANSTATSINISNASFNATYATNISALQVNDTYFNGTGFPVSTDFRNNTMYDHFESNKVNKTGDTMTGNLDMGTHLINLTSPGMINSTLPAASAFIMYNGASIIGDRNQAIRFINQNSGSASAIVLGAGATGSGGDALFINGVNYADSQRVDILKNMTILTSGKGIILKSPDGTKCGFLNWTNANTFATTAITCP